MAKQKIPAMPSIRRLPSYLYIVQQAHQINQEYISGTVIAQELKLEPIQVRKDLAITGIVGRPKKGYPTTELMNAINRFLGWDTIQPAILVGAGNLGTALAGYEEFRLHGINIFAAFDAEKKKVGTSIHRIPVYPLSAIDKQVKKSGAKIAILTVPSEHAQEAANLIIEAGITAIWNFTNHKLNVPDHVVVQKEDLSSGFAILSVMMRNRDQ
ncbi:MAG TPA: redox-sensing transcriptional repressor Rex [Treponema sp.]|nr:redox-sensing transcriptional repressor Rex [Treponema sp.]